MPATHANRVDDFAASTEASLGHPDAAQRRLTALLGLVELQATQAVKALGRELITRNA